MLKRARKLTGNSRYEELAGQLVLLAGGAAEKDPQNAQRARRIEAAVERRWRWNGAKSICGAG